MHSFSIDISKFVANCQHGLIETSPTSIPYKDKKALSNNSLPPSLGGDAVNVYALWKRADESAPWHLMYIGERKSKYAWARVKQHLFSTPSGTKSKLAQVKLAVEAGDDIGVTAIHVSPDSIRLAVEEELIALNSKAHQSLPWNQKARAPAGHNK